ncbi:MAG: hypothetical protein NT144_08570 [Bacteroidia bacterium]|nr:hypothetical protein [Bacteroidia bacterium]
MKTLLNIFAILVLSASISAQNQNKTIYVDSFNGNDNNPGTTPELAWKSLNKVNSVINVSGAKLLFKTGCYWRGQLAPKGSGSKSESIIIGSYGKGPLPIIDGAGMEGEGVLRLNNQSFWEISELQIINNAEIEGDRRGVEIKAANYGLAQHIHLRNLIINNIKGIPGNDMKSKKTAAIYIATESDSTTATRFDDILIEGCLIYNVDNQGIVLNNEVSNDDYPGTKEWDKRKFTNVIVRNNIIHHIAKNAMIIRLTDNGIVEHNLCYETALKTTGNTIFSRSAKGTVFQYNEGFLNRSPDYDGSFYDPDLNSPGTVWQYSLSHHNTHGLIWFCNTKNDSAVIVRDNISFNDKGALVYINYAFADAKIFNNTFYIGPGYSPVLIRENPKNYHKYSFYNNTVFNKSESASLLFSNEKSPAQIRSFYGNKISGSKIANPLPGLFDNESALSESPALLQNITGFPVPDINHSFIAKDPFAQIGDLPVTFEELTREMLRFRALVMSEFASKPGSQPEKLQLIDTNGSELYEALKKTALAELIKIKIIQSMMINKKIAFENNYPVILSQLSKLNSKRDSLIKSGNTVFGPNNYNEQTYFDYLFSNALICLKESLYGHEIIVTEKLLGEYYKKNKPIKDWKRYTNYTEHYLRVKEEYFEEQFSLLLENEAFAASYEESSIP